ncbi:MAG TPA: hypothetical protein VGW77_30315 [Candidatus Binatia bacterium]|jgi:hypothetical protein|nr:hypothetical protein [Candidatus Binatia bacterium]
MMAKKRYPNLPDGSAATESLIREAKAETYGREKRQKDFLQSAINLTSLKRKLKRPARRSKSEIAWALEIAGIGEGPEDLSKNMRQYLASDQ